MNYSNLSLYDIFRKYSGIFEIAPKISIRDQYSFSLIHTPGSLEVCSESLFNNFKIIILLIFVLQK